MKILVPGAGLARLPFEIISRGYSCQGNEFSYFMLLASNFILNQPIEQESITIHPWIHQYSNIPSEAIQSKSFLVPDVVVSKNIDESIDFSMVGGDFIQIYGDSSQTSQWDVICTCYFIDTAKNVYEYLKVIKNALKPNGKWINLGPLLFHHEGEADSVEFTAEEVLDMVESMGFTMTVNVFVNKERFLNRWSICSLS
jgi:carnosine N-methyltransferase